MKSLEWSKPLSEDPLFVALSFEDVLEETGRSPGTIRRWVRDGKLRAYVLDGRKVFVRRDVLQVEAEMAKRYGRPGARIKTDPL
jgi:excisionase family DNA binding protein